MVSFMPAPLYPHGNGHGIPLIGGLVGLRASLGMVVKRKIFAPDRNQTLVI